MASSYPNPQYAFGVRVKRGNSLCYVHSLAPYNMGVHKTFWRRPTKMSIMLWCRIKVRLEKKKYQLHNWCNDIYLFLIIVQMMFYWSFLVFIVAWLKNMIFLSSYEMKENLLPHLALKKGWGDYNVMLTLSVATWVWMPLLVSVISVNISKYYFLPLFRTSFNINYL